jgi:hypothetical protein
MKWINLADRLPDHPLHKYIVRVIGTNSNVISVMPHRYKTEWGQLVLTDQETVWNLGELEWLDESEDAALDKLKSHLNGMLSTYWSMDISRNQENIEKAIKLASKL